MEKIFDVVVVGGSYAGLSAALCLSRVRRQVAVIDSLNAANKTAVQARNFLTRDGENPDQLRRIARDQLSQYHSCLQVEATASALSGHDGAFVLHTLENGNFFCRKIIFCTGLSDIMPGIAGFKECWGKSIFHCPYCHAFELPDQPLSVIAGGEQAIHLLSVLRPMFSNIRLFTHGAEISGEVTADFMVTQKISAITHRDGHISSIETSDGRQYPCRQAFAKVLLKQQCEIPEKAGCDFKGHLLQVDDCYRTTKNGILAAGDNCHLPRTISLAVAAGTRAAFQANAELCRMGV